MFSDGTVAGSTIYFPTTSPLTLADADSTDTLLANSGIVHVSADSTGVGPAVNIAAGATVYLDGSQDLSSLTIQPGGLARVAQDGSIVITLGSLDLQPATDQLPAACSTCPTTT